MHQAGHLTKTQNNNKTKHKI